MLKNYAFSIVVVKKLPEWLDISYIILIIKAFSARMCYQRLAAPTVKFVFNMLQLKRP